MKHPASQHLFDYWNTVRGSRTMPEGRDIDPAAFRGILADTMMIDVERGERGDVAYPIRLAGTRVNALFGFDIKGRSLPSLWRLPDQAELQGLIATVLDGMRPAVAGVETAPVGERALTLELLLLPLRHKGRTHARLLGALSPKAVPSWLGLQPTSPLVLGPYRLVDPSLPERGTQVRDFAKPCPPGLRHNHFVVLQGGRV